jgi:hypothetical protein
VGKLFGNTLVVPKGPPIFIFVHFLLYIYVYIYFSHITVVIMFHHIHKTVVMSSSFFVEVEILTFAT